MPGGESHQMPRLWSCHRFLVDQRVWDGREGGNDFNGLMVFHSPADTIFYFLGVFPLFSLEWGFLSDTIY